jgi:hypothetical protein
MDSRGKRVVRVLFNGAALAAAALGGLELHERIPHVIHAAVFLGAAGVSAALILFGTQVFGKLDKTLEGTEKFDTVRTESAYQYVAGLRRRLVMWLSGASISFAAAAAVASILRDGSLVDDRPAIVVGYLALAVIGLTAYRLVSAYLSLDGFRFELLTSMAREQKRADALKALDPGDILPDSSKATPMKVVRRRPQG